MGSRIFRGGCSQGSKLTIVAGSRKIQSSSLLYVMTESKRLNAQPDGDRGWMRGTGLGPHREQWRLFILPKNASLRAIGAWHA